MRVVAIGAIGRIRIPTGMIDAMLTVVVQLDLLGVTHGTVNAAAGPADGLSSLAYIGMALDTGITAVSGMDQFFLINVKRNCFTVDFFLEVGI